MHWIKDIYSVLYVYYIYPVNNVLVLLLSRLVKDGFISYQLGDLSVVITSQTFIAQDIFNYTW